MGYIIFTLANIDEDVYRFYQIGQIIEHASRISSITDWIPDKPKGVKC